MKEKVTLNPSEAEEQATVIEFCDLLGIPAVHIPNEGKRSYAAGAALRRGGLRRGFPDLFIPLALKGYHGLFIEMKSRGGRVSAEQKEWLQRLSASGYCCAICYGADEAIRVIKKYTENEKKGVNS